MGENEAWMELEGKQVIIDTDSQFIYIGILDKVEDHFISLRDVDVHDRSEGSGTKEQYVMDAKRHGINANRRNARVRKSLVVGVSLLDDVILY